MKSEKKKRGGVWSGAGHPIDGEHKRVMFCARISPDTYEKISEQAEALGISRGKTLDVIVSGFYDLCQEQE